MHFPTRRRLRTITFVVALALARADDAAEDDALQYWSPAWVERALRAAAIPPRNASETQLLEPGFGIPGRKGGAMRDFRDGDVGARLTGHPNVDMVGFTGSTATGQKILNTASKTLKPVVLECGGKDPMVVLEDADLELAAHDAVAYSLANCGQVCCAVERVYVAASVAEDFESKVKAEASK